MRLITLSLAFCALLAAQINTDVRSGVFRGLPVTYKVIDGLAILEDDILLGSVAEMEAGGAQKTASKDSLIVPGDRFRWTNATIPYEIDAAVPNPQRVRDAVAYWNANTPIKIAPHAGEANWLHFIRLQNFGVCSSSIGMVGGEQTIRVDDLCGAGTLIHEIGHTVGLYHEMSRVDRDRYVNVAFENIDKTLVGNFNQNVTADPVAPYDFGSIMHYGRYSDARNPFIPTIETIPAGIPLGQNVALSPEEIVTVKSMYGQPPKGTLITSTPTGMSIVVDGGAVTTPQTFDWPVGSVHTLEATGPQGDATVRYVFGRWSDEGEAAHTITVADGVSIYGATFIQQFPLRTSVLGSGKVTIDPPSESGFYATGSVIKLTATPADGFSFLHYTGFVGTLQGTLANPTLLRLTFTGANYVANFIPRRPTVVTTDPPGLAVTVDGSTTTTPRGFDFAVGSAHTIAVASTIAPSAGVRYVFDGWSDGGELSHGITAQAGGATYTAVFTTQRQLTTNGGGAGGTIRATPPSSNGFYDEGTSVQVMATPASGFAFANWSGDLTGAGATKTIMMNDQQFVTASFVRAGALTANSILHGATMQPGAVAAGEEIAIFGSEIGVEGNPSATAVFFDGAPATVVSASPTRVVALVPLAVAGKRTTSVQLAVSGRRSAAVVLGVLEVRPGLFTADGSGSGPALALGDDTVAISDANPVARGAVVHLFATGAGSASPAVRAQIGGQEAEVVYVGQAEGRPPGVLRVSVRVPDGVAPGSAAVRVFFGYTPSPASVVLAVL